VIRLATGAGDEVLLVPMQGAAGARGEVALRVDHGNDYPRRTAVARLTHAGASALATSLLDLGAVDLQRPRAVSR